MSRENNAMYYTPIPLIQPEMKHEFKYDFPRMRPASSKITNSSDDFHEHEPDDYCISTRILRNLLAGILAVSAVLFIGMGILVTMYLTTVIDNFIYKEMELKVGGEVFDKWRKPPLEPATKIFFFNLTNPTEFMQGQKPVFKQIGPYVYREQWEKVNITWHSNGTVSYVPTKKFFFNREASSGSEDDIVQTLNIPLISAADQMKYAVRLTRLALSSMLGVLNQETFAVHSVRELMWGYSDSLFKLAKDVMPPENVVPHDEFGLFVGKNNTGADGTFTVFTGRDSMKNYAHIDNWNGFTRMSHWRPNSECNLILGTDGTAFPPNLTPNTTLHLYNPEFCRSIPLVFHKEVVHSGVLGYRFGPPTNIFDRPDQNPANECFCPPGLSGASCGIQGLYNISACKFGAPMSISFPHFLYGDPKLVSDVVGLSPDPELHSFYMDFMPKLSLPLQAKARMQVNLMLSKVDDIKQVAGIPEIVYPVLWFETGVDAIPEEMMNQLKMVSELPETARAGMSYSMFGLGGILLLCVALLIWKGMKSKSYGSENGMERNDVEFEKRADSVTVSPPKSEAKVQSTENDKGTT